jgi:hypothetical protein
MTEEEIENKKPINNIINYSVVFYEDKPKENTWGSNAIMYELYYRTEDGIMNIFEVGSFGDRTLVRRIWDKRQRGITLKEMLEDIEEISNLTYKEFKEKVLGKG